MKLIAPRVTCQGGTGVPPVLMTGETPMPHKKHQR